MGRLRKVGIDFGLRFSSCFCKVSSPICFFILVSNCSNMTFSLVGRLLLLFDFVSHICLHLVFFIN